MKHFGGQLIISGSSIAIGHIEVKHKTIIIDSPSSEIADHFGSITPGGKSFRTINNLTLIDIKKEKSGKVVVLMNNPSKGSKRYCVVDFESGDEIWSSSLPADVEYASAGPMF